MDRARILETGTQESWRKEIKQQPKKTAHEQRSRLCSMLWRNVALAVIVLELTTLTGARDRKKTAPPAVPSDQGYVFALAAANRFLHAWQAGDLADGMVLISDGIRHSQNADALEQFFSAETDRAFEIRTGHGNHGRYSFPVVLIHVQGSGIVRKSSDMILVNTGKNDWAVDKLP